MGSGVLTGFEMGIDLDLGKCFAYRHLDLLNEVMRPGHAPLSGDEDMHRHEAISPCLARLQAMELQLSRWPVINEGLQDVNHPRVVVLGEAKSGEQVRTLRDLERLRHIQGVLAGRGTDVASAVLAVFGRGGFDKALRAAEAADPMVRLIDLADLYR